MPKQSYDIEMQTSIGKRYGTMTVECNGQGTYQPGSRFRAKQYGIQAIQTVSGLWRHMVSEYGTGI